MLDHYMTLEHPGGATQGACGGLYPGYFKLVVSKLFLMCLLFSRDNLYSGRAVVHGAVGGGSNSGRPAEDLEATRSEVHLLQPDQPQWPRGVILEGGCWLHEANLSRTGTTTVQGLLRLPLLAGTRQECAEAGGMAAPPIQPRPYRALPDTRPCPLELNRRLHTTQATHLPISAPGLLGTVTV